MTAVCKEWTQPDGDHFHGLCVNTFNPTTAGDIEADGCDVCLTPHQQPTPCDLYGNGSASALFSWRGQYYVGPPTYSATPASNWLDTWHPFFNLHIPVGTFASSGGDLSSGHPSNPAYYCPDQYTSLSHDFLLKSADHCEDWVGVETDESEIGALAVANAPLCSVVYGTSPRFKLFSTTISNPSITLLWIELQIKFKIFHPGTEYTIRCRTTPQASQLFFNMNGSYEFYEARNAISGSPWVTFTTTDPIVITPL